MKKQNTITNGLIVVAVLGAMFLANYYFSHRNTLFLESIDYSNSNTDYKNSTYTIEGQSITLKDGHSEISIVPGSASKLITQYFGNEAVGDLNGDGVPDVAFILTQNSGGSGTFYYVVVALQTPTGYKGTNAILLGDRIAPQTTEIKNGELVVNYADRKIGEPMITPPSVGVSKYIKVSGYIISEIN